MGEAKRRAAIPGLREHLERLGSFDPKARNEFEAFADWTRRMLDHHPLSDPDQAAMLVMVQNASLAIVESANHAIYELGLDVGQATTLLCRSLGVAFGYGLMSLNFKEGAPIRDFVRPLTEEFRIGAKMAIDQCEEEMARTSEGGGAT